MVLSIGNQTDLDTCQMQFSSVLLCSGLSTGLSLLWCTYDHVLVLLLSCNVTMLMLALELFLMRRAACSVMKSVAVNDLNDSI